MKVLFIEDDPMNWRVVRDMLTVAGVEMDEAENGEVGLAKSQPGLYDLFLVDLRMPGMDGMEVIRRIRARTDATSKSPIIVVTADLAIDLRAQCEHAGADDFLEKPVAMDALFESIARVITAKGLSLG